MKKARLCVLAVVLGLFILGLTSSNAGAVYVEDGFEDVVTTSAQLQEEPEYVPGEIIVKLKNKEIVDELDAAINRSNKIKKLTMDSALSRVSALDQLKASVEGEIYKIEPVFPALKEKIEDTGMTELEIQGTISSAGTEEGRLYNFAYVYRFTVDPSVNIPEACAELEGNPNVEYAEPNYIYELYAVPNDPYYHSSGSWGQDYDDLWGLKKIQCETAWDITTGSPEVIVAVVDTGVDYNHEDLAAHIWINEGEIPDNGIDDDDNGYIDDVRGWDFADDDNDPSDYFGHGTHVSGTIAAIGNNGIGVVGVSWNSKIMALKGFPSSTTALANCVVYAANNGAQVINNSWGGGPSYVVKEVVDYAHDVHNCVVVAAAGNKNIDTSPRIVYPADLNNAITVAAFDSNDEKAWFSNWGAKIDVAAPGVDILSLRSEGAEMGGDSKIVGENYLWVSGTSMAAPHVSGLAALILAHHPEFTNEEVRQVLRKGADDVDEPGWDIHAGHGRINASASLNLDSVCSADIASPAIKTAVSGIIDITGTAGGDNFLSYRLEYGNGEHPTEWVLIGDECFSPVFQGVLLASVETAYIKDGYNILRLTVTDTFGNEFIDYSTITTDAIAITSPRDNDLFHWGANLIIEGTARGTGFEYYTLEYAPVSDPDNWSSEGITLEGDGLSPIEDGILGSWDTSVISGRDGHIIRLSVHQGDFVNQEAIVVYLDPFLDEGWPVTMEVDGIVDAGGCPLVAADIVGDERLEILLKGRRNIFAYHHDGTAVIGWPKVMGAAFSSGFFPGVSVGNLDGLDEQGFAAPEIVSSWREDLPGTLGAHAWHSDGTEVADWPIQLGYGDNDGASHSSMVLADLDNNGDLEVIANASELQKLFVWKYDGSSYEGWPYEFGGQTQLIGSPAVGDIDGDGDMEIISLVRVYSSDDSSIDGFIMYMYCWSSQGIVEDGFPAYLGLVDATGYSSPVLVDLDNDGYLEIGYTAEDDLQGLINFRHHDGSQVQGWPYYIDQTFSKSFAVGDLDKDGEVDIVFGSSFFVGGNLEFGEGKIYALEGDGALKDGWPRDADGAIMAAPTIGDLDSDGYPDIAATTWTGLLCAWDRHGNPLDFSPRRFPVSVYMSDVSGAVISDIDADGDIELVVAPSNGKVYVWDLPGKYNKDTMEWPMFQGNPQRTGCYSKPLTQTIDLSAGWNLFSLGLNPYGSHDMLDILAPILDHVAMAQDEAGNRVELDSSGEWRNSIGDWQATEGYIIYVDQAVTLEVAGREIAKPLSVPLHAGGSYVSYPYLNESRDALEVLQPLIDAGYLDKVYDEEGNSIIEAMDDDGNNAWVNSIGDMRPGEGYHLRVNTACTLEMN